jgi:hypothetical protein
MSTRLRSRFAALGVSAALSGALMLGLSGTASAAPAAALPTAQVATPTSVTLTDRDHNRHCRRQWHGDSWSWRDDGDWDRHHHWRHHRSHHFRHGWWSWECR